MLFARQGRRNDSDSFINSGATCACVHTINTVMRQRPQLWASVQINCPLRVAWLASQKVPPEARQNRVATLPNGSLHDKRERFGSSKIKQLSKVYVAQKKVWITIYLQLGLHHLRFTVTPISIPRARALAPAWPW